MANGGGREEGLDVRRQEGEGEIVENELDCSIHSSLRRLPVKYVDDNSAFYSSPSSQIYSFKHGYMGLKNIIIKISLYIPTIINLPLAWAMDGGVMSGFGRPSKRQS